ncbi:MAG: hypothetical protein HKN42_14820 [Granulosicoccus sp.]|nr:hypothetical protein [Granulosicoccus sp.]
MFKTLLLSFSIALTASVSIDVRAQASTHTLFAVDLSLSARQRSTAYDIVREVTLNAPKAHTIGLTLFDDTVRRFVAPAMLNVEQIRAINDALADSVVSVRSSSNLAVGIERALDYPELREPANLIVFARGVIDTPTQDPRARFSEWLALVLLPLATEENISITLLVPEDQAADPAISQAFESSAKHKVVTFNAGEHTAPFLVSLLGIADRPYGEVSLASSPDTATHTATGTGTGTNTITGTGTDTITAQITGTDTSATFETGATGTSATRAENASLTTVQTNEKTTPAMELWLTARIPLLFIATLVLCGIVYWRLRARQKTSRHTPASTASSTYLPLTEKPANTMNSWMGDQTIPSGSQSIDSRSTSDSDTTAPRSAGSVRSKRNEPEPWDQ